MNRALMFVFTAAGVGPAALSAVHEGRWRIGPRACPSSTNPVNTPDKDSLFAKDDTGEMRIVLYNSRRCVGGMNVLIYPRWNRKKTGAAIATSKDLIQVM
jgi:hypothetical protein